MQFGRQDMSHTANLIGHGKAIKDEFFSIPLAIMAAALSACMKNGIGQVFLSVMRDFTNPGQMMLT